VSVRGIKGANKQRERERIIRKIIFHVTSAPEQKKKEIEKIKCVGGLELHLETSEKL